MATFPHQHSTALPALRNWTPTLAAIAAYAIWLVVAYWDTVASMVSIWYRSETFAHGFVVFPISAWIVWRKRRELAALEPHAELAPWPVIAIALAAALWFAGDLADVLAARHIAWITMLVAGICLLVGGDVARRLMFALGFLYFAVPIGEFLLPTLIEWTANVTIGALRLSGVPVLRDGMNFVIPSGAWSVVEACSGLRYLIASVTVGTLFAYLAYRSPLRRAAFVAASIAVPIVANWGRAYMIVMLGHLSGNRIAIGVDHIIYGWVFFGAVMLLLFWVGNFWREDDPITVDTEASGSGTARSGPSARAAVFATLLAMTALPPLGSWLLQDSTTQRVAVDTSPPALAPWRPSARSLADWTPQFTPPRAAITSTYANGDVRAALYVALYYDQDRDSKLVSSANQLLRTTDRSGYVVSSRRRTLDGLDGPLDVVESVLRVRETTIVARRWYYVDGERTASDLRAKLLQARARLAKRGDAGAIVVVWMPVSDAAADRAALDDLTRRSALELPPVLAQRLRQREVDR